ncbi:hypothetical protein BDF20DRAFT_824377 [Mycotypha africana]|uniref:uncharacterized protein n=1 Tax=Mycotypha africana TaxID=64632 RepID=UPI0023014AFA|nr:uncharacterized protein BDF20DRAFT_824377 [Mycotypha africana]KAI8973577.1 hypothetical protein BDF20DRAFT_824377 [Mycotypha africana]
MDKELYSLVLGYRECLEKISELNSETVRENVDLRRSSIEQQLTVNKKLDEIIGKLKLDNDKVLNKQLMDAEAAKLGVQVYLDNVIWKLFSRTELLNNALLFNNDLNRINDKKCLMKLMETFIHIDRETQTNFFLADLHSWMLHVSAIYLRLCTTDEKKYIVELLSKTTHIADWAMPMIQFKMEKMSKADDYVAILKLVLSNSHSDPLMEDNRLHWTEDDYLAVIEQLAIDYNLLNVIDNLPSDINPQMLFILCQKLADALMTAIQLLKPMKMLAKRLSQIQHIDLFISQLVKGFYDMEGGSGWSFLANIKYDALSINALWDITLHMLHINTNIIPSATSDVLNDNLPSTTRFQYELQENQTQGYFLLNCQQQQPTPILFARYILEHLNYGLRDDTVESSDISKAQPWYDRKMPFLTYDIHEEIASILLDACQQYLPLPDSMSNDETKNDGNSVSNKRVENSSSRNSSVNAPEFIDWAWTIVMQLKLFDCPSSPRANDMEATIDISFLRQVLNHPHPATASHGALLIYISFMLSTTSRHFLRFETAHGWMKLLVLLRRSNKPEVLIQILSEIIPSFVYMHGDDFFNDESWNDLLKQMIFGDNTTGIGFIMFSNFWHAHLIDSVSHLLDEKGKGFSYVDLVMHSWLKSIFKRHDWMWHQAYVGMMDTLCQTAWTLRNKNRLVHHMLLEEYKRIQKAKEQYNANSPRLSRMLKNMVIPEDAVATLIIGEWSVLRTTNTFNKSTPGIENRLFWFAFEALMVETTAEQSLREEIAEQTASHAKKPIEYFAIYRWLQHILIMPFDHPLLPLYLQMFFSLYYQAIVESGNISISGGTLFFEKKQDLIQKLQNYIANLQTYHGQKLTTTYNSSDNTASLYVETLQQLYYAMWLWLGNAELTELKADFHDLPTLYDPPRLGKIYARKEQEQPWVTNEVWLDVIDLNYLERTFLAFPWAGASKFNKKRDEKELCQQSLRSKSSSANIVASSASSLSIPTSTTTRRGVRILTDESVIKPLPPLCINEPTTTSTGSISKRLKK